MVVPMRKSISHQHWIYINVCLLAMAKKIMLNNKNLQLSQQIHFQLYPLVYMSIYWKFLQVWLDYHHESNGMLLAFKINQLQSMKVKGVILMLNFWENYKCHLMEGICLHDLDDWNLYQCYYIGKYFKR